MVIQNPIQLGSALHARRVELGITQEALADVIGVHRRVIGELERGKRTVQLQIVIEVARALGLDIELSPRGR